MLGSADAIDWRAVALRRQHAAYIGLGTPEQRQANYTYTTLRYGNMLTDVVVDGEVYTARQINGMTDDQRNALAEAYLLKKGWTGPLQEYQGMRAEFLDDPEHQEYVQFRDWQSAVSAYEGGPAAYWEDLAAENPTARHYYGSIGAIDARDTVIQDQLVSLTAFMHAKGIRPTAFDRVYPPALEVFDPLGILTPPD